MMGSKRARWALVIVGVAALVVVATAAARTQSAASKTVTIGWAYDGQSGGPMNPFDAPALAAAQLEANKINAHGGADGHGMKIVIKTCNTQGDNAAISKSCADKLISQDHANVLFTTCDVDLAAPAAQEGLNAGLLTVAPCIGTDQMGPKRFGTKGKLAFSFGNVAQDEGSAMAQLAWDKHWKTADLAKDTQIVYFEAVVSAFKARFTQLGGKIKYQTTYKDPALPGGSLASVSNAVSGIAAHPSAVVVTSTAGAYGALAPFIVNLRSAGDKAAVLNSWAGDGNYWFPSSPKVSNYWFVTYANAFGHDPNHAINVLASQIHAATGGFVAGPAAIDGLVTAIKRAGGSLTGSKLAAQMVKFHDVPTLSGLVSFSATHHTCYGRSYRVIEVNNNTPIEKQLIKALKVPWTSPDS
jgi:ABC-type branched-subunit amino acid transport system substrate-binding protein